MADDTTLNPGLGGDVIATDDLGGRKVQWVKVGFGADGSLVAVQDADGLGLPVQLAPGDVVTDTLDSNGDVMLIPTLGAPVVVVQFITNTLAGTTILTEGSVDGGTTWGTILSISGSAIATTGGSQLTQNANPAYINAAGLTHVRLRVSAFGSGAALIMARTSNAATVHQLVNGAIGSISQITGGVVPGTAATSLGKAEDAAHVSADVGVFMLGVRQDVTNAAQTSNNGDYGYLNLDAANALRVTFSGTSLGTGAATVHRFISAATTNATSIKGTIGNLYGAIVGNANAAIRFLKFYNKATAPTVGTDVPVLVIPIPPGVWALDLSMRPHNFSAGIAYATTVGGADADVAAVAASEIFMTGYYI